MQPAVRCPPIAFDERGSGWRTLRRSEGRALRERYMAMSGRRPIPIDDGHGDRVAFEPAGNLGAPRARRARTEAALGAGVAARGDNSSARVSKTASVRPSRATPSSDKSEQHGLTLKNLAPASSPHSSCADTHSHVPMRCAHQRDGVRQFAATPSHAGCSPRIESALPGHSNSAQLAPDISAIR